MPFVVVDTSVSLPATLSPKGLTRKFWILLAYGGLTYRMEHLRRDLDELESQAADEGGEIGGTNALDDLVELASVRKATLAERLPYDAPTNWVAVGGTYVSTEYRRTVGTVAARMGLDISDAEAEILTRQMQAVCAVAAPPFQPIDVPQLTSDPNDDPIVYTALLAGADLLISDDHDIVPRDAEGCWLIEHGERSVLAMTFDHLVSNYLTEIEWDEIDGAWLAYAHAPTDS